MFPVKRHRFTGRVRVERSNAIEEHLVIGVEVGAGLCVLEVSVGART